METAGPSTEEWIKKIYVIGQYSVIKRNRIGSFGEVWMDLESVIQSEVSQKEKSSQHTLTHICGFEQNGLYDLIYKSEIDTQT